MTPLAHDRGSLRQLAHGYYFSCALYAAVTLGLAEALAAGPCTADALAKELGTNLDTTTRLVGFLASFGVLNLEGQRGYALTDTGRHLCADHPKSLAREVTMFAGGETFRAWGGLVDTMRSGTAAFELEHGKQLFQYLADNPEPADRFHRAWHEITTACAEETAEAYDFDSVGTVTDVGGGYGIFLATLLKARPMLKAVLFDLPFSTKGAPKSFEDAGVSDRVKIVLGNAEESIPPMEIAVIKSVIHGCDDEQTVRILRNTAAALPPRGKVIVIERVIPDDPGFHWSRLVDMTMMVMTGGRERTRAHYERLYRESGFKLTRAPELPCGFSLIEGEKVG